MKSQGSNNVVNFIRGSAISTLDRWILTASNSSPFLARIKLPNPPQHPYGSIEVIGTRSTGVQRHG